MIFYFDEYQFFLFVYCYTFHIVCMNQDYIRAANKSLKLTSDHLSVKHLFMSAPPNKTLISLISDSPRSIFCPSLNCSWTTWISWSTMKYECKWIECKNKSLRMYNTWNLKHNSQRLFPMLFVVVVLLLSVSPFPAGFAGRPTEIELQMRWLQNVWSNAECVVKHSINHVIGHEREPRAAHTPTSTTCACHQMTNIAKDTTDQAFGAFTQSKTCIGWALTAFYQHQLYQLSAACSIL